MALASAALLADLSTGPLALGLNWLASDFLELGRPCVNEHLELGRLLVVEPLELGLLC